MYDSLERLINKIQNEYFIINNEWNKYQKDRKIN